MGNLKVTNLKVTDGDGDDEVNLSWESVAGAEHYVIQLSRQPLSRSNTNSIKPALFGRNKWEVFDIINEPAYTLAGLKPGKKYFFRVAAVSRKKQGPWSSSIEKHLK